MDRRARAVLWLDGGAAWAAGSGMLLLREWLARLHGISPALVAVLGSCNLLYASYSGRLAVLASRGTPPSRLAIDVLVVANFVWAATCAAMLVTFWDSATLFGLAHLALEGLFVCALAVAERRIVRPLSH